MTDDASPTLRRRELGAALRRLRHERGLAAEDVATALRCSLSKVSRFETSARGVNARDLDALIVLFGLEGREADDLRALALDAKKRGWWQRQELPATSFTGLQHRSFIGLEQSASEIREFTSGVVPGLLQTREYMRASVIGSAPDLGADAIEAVVATRQRRQELLSSSGSPSFEVVIDEAALWRIVGSVETMRDQLVALFGASEQGVVSLHVLPFDAGAHPGVNSSFIALTMPGVGVGDVVLVEGLSGQTLFEDEASVERYRVIWNHLLGVADGPDDAADRLRAIIRRIESGP